MSNSGPEPSATGNQAEKLAVHPAMSGLVNIDTEHRQDTSKVDTHVVHRAGTRDVLYCHASQGMNLYPVRCLNSPRSGPGTTSHGADRQHP